MKRLYLHIGTHKTGTTAIQRNIEAVESDLKKEKIIYLQTPSIFEEMTDLETVDEDMIIECREYLNKNTKKYSEDYKFVMSNEHFSGSGKHGHYKATAKMLRQITRKQLNLCLICPTLFLTLEIFTALNKNIIRVLPCTIK